MKLRLDIDKFRSDTYDMDAETKSQFLNCIFKLAEGELITDQNAHTFFSNSSLLRPRFTINNGEWSHSDIKKVKPAEAPKKESSEHHSVIRVYYEWFEHKFGIKPSIQAKDVAAVKSIIKFLKANAKNQEMYSASELLMVIFNNWDKLNDWTQRQTSLAQINSQINSIVTQLKHESDERQRISEASSFMSNPNF